MFTAGACIICLSVRKWVVGFIQLKLAQRLA